VLLVLFGLYASSLALTCVFLAQGSQVTPADTAFIAFLVIDIIGRATFMTLIAVYLTMVLRMYAGQRDDTVNNDELMTPLTGHMRDSKDVPEAYNF